MKKRERLILVLAALLLLAGFLFYNSPFMRQLEVTSQYGIGALTPTPLAIPQPTEIPSEQACQQALGTWAKLGAELTPSCHKLPAGDVGKLCTNSSQCEGFCTPPDKALALSAISTPAVKLWGTCSEQVKDVGCHLFMEDGVMGNFCGD